MRKSLIILIAALLLCLPRAVFAASVFTRNLYFGMYGDPDVKALQDFLRERGYLSLPSTGNYLGGTIQAVKKFQKAHGLPPIGGYVGPESRRVANEMLAAQHASKQQENSGGGTPTPPPSSSSPLVTGTATTSPAKGKIFFSSVQSSGTAQDERIVISNQSYTEKVSITGFSITTQRGQHYVIPLAFGLPGFSATPSDVITLRPRDRAVVSVGTQNKHINFRENLCTGYFDETSYFSPGLSHRCPVPDTRTLHHLSDQCVQAISGIPSCRTGPLPEFLDPTRPECAYYIADNFNYAGCVAHYRSRSDFYNDQWLVWMQRSVPFFNKRFDTVTLKDQQDRTVDEYSYSF